MHWHSYTVTEAAAGREVIRQIVARSDLDDFTDGVLSSFADRMEYRRIRPPLEEMRVWVRWNIDLVVRWLVDNQPPSETELDSFRELGRVSAANGAPVDSILGNYRRAARFAWETLQQSATQEERAALLDGASKMFDFVDLVSRAFSDAFEEAMRTGPRTDEERSAQHLLARLGANEDLLQDDLHFAGSIGFNVLGPFRPFVVMSTGHSASQHIGLARRLIGRHVLAISRGRSVTGLANDQLKWHDLDLGAEAVYIEGDLSQKSEIGVALEELHAFAEVAIARGHSGEVTLDQFQCEVLLHLSPRVASRLVARIYGPLQSEGGELARTLDSFVEHDFDRAATAQSLPVHRNTLTNRLNRIRALTGIDFDSAEGLTQSWFAWLGHSRPAIDRDEVAPFKGWPS
jgi:DNA-binding PucR family transcriptional regulator